jgi:hypothetical protein
MTENEFEPEPVRRGRKAMCQPVADFADPVRPWRLDLQCAGSCPVQHRPVTELVRVVPAGMTWAKAIPKMRCGRCGEPVAIAGLSGPSETPSAGFPGCCWSALAGGGDSLRCDGR